MKVDFRYDNAQLKQWIGNAPVAEAPALDLKKAQKLIARAKKYSAQAPKILVLDDDEAILDLFKRLFLAKGYTGHYATRARRAAELCQKNKIDLIICDLMMPDVDGYAFIRTIRRVPATREIPIIVYSALDPRVAIKDLKGSRVDAFIQKPGDMAALLKRIAGFLEAAIQKGVEEEE